ncbi:MAG: hypothetical protein AAGH72_13205 [Verrucomicrobiota bacterium]
MATPPPPSAPKLPPGAKLPAKPPGSVQMPQMPAGTNIPKQTINVGAAMGAARLTSKAPASPVPAAPAPGGVSNPNLKVTQGKIKKETMRISLPPKPGSQPGKPVAALGGVKPAPPKPVAAVPPAPKPPSGPLSELNVTRPMGGANPNLSTPKPQPAQPGFNFPAPAAKPAVTETTNIQAQEEPTAMIPGGPVVPKPKATAPKPTAPAAPAVPAVPPTPAPSPAAQTKILDKPAPAPAPPKPPSPVAPKAPAAPSAPTTPLQKSAPPQVAPAAAGGMKMPLQGAKAKTESIQSPPTPPRPAAPAPVPKKAVTQQLSVGPKGAPPQVPAGTGLKPPAPAVGGPKPAAPAPAPASPAPAKQAPPKQAPLGSKAAPPAAAGKQPARVEAPAAGGGGGGNALAIVAGLISLISAAVILAGFFDIL